MDRHEVAEGDALMTTETQRRAIAAIYANTAKSSAVREMAARYVLDIDDEDDYWDTIEDYVWNDALSDDENEMLMAAQVILSRWPAAEFNEVVQAACLADAEMIRACLDH
jgi:hypothetical protein